MFERETYGLYYGLLAGVIWDMNLGSGDGFNALFFAFVGFFCGLLMTYLMMNNLITATILCTSVTLIYFLLNWIIFVAVKGYDGGASILFRQNLPTAVLNIVTLPIYFYGIREIMKNFKLKESDELSF
jgi:rod shape-determining protein MreD